MVRKTTIYKHLSHRKGMPLVLASCWLLGLLCGLICYSFSRPDALSLMRRVAFRSVSIVGLLNAVFIPFLLSAFFVMLSMPKMLFVICFLKAFLFSFVSLGILLDASSGGWLLRYFLLFDDCTMLPLLYWYWLHSVSTDSGSHWSSAATVCGAFVLAVYLDYRIIAPFCVLDRF